MSEAKIFDAEYYRRNYPDYARQNPPRKLHFYRGLAEDALVDVAHPHVLDIGCAFGAFLGALPDHWMRHGVDPSAHAIGAARSAVPGAHMTVGSADAVPLSGPYDLITAYDTLEHVEDLDRVAAELKRLLTANGKVIFVVPVYDGPTGPIIHALDRDPTHVHKRGRDFWLDWANTRFSVVNWQGIYRYLIPGGYYAHIPTQRLRAYTPAIAVTCRVRPGAE